MKKEYAFIMQKRGYLTSLILGTQASRLRGPRKQREVGCSLRAFWNKTKVLAVIVAPYKPFTYKKRLPNLTC